MLETLINAVNNYRLEHSRCEASGHKTSELNDTYAEMLHVCDTAQHRVQRTDEACSAERHDYYNALLAYVFCPYCGERLLIR